MAKFTISKLGDTTQPESPNTVGAWCSKHWFLTFLIASSVIALPVSIIKAAKKPAATDGATSIPR